MKSVISINKKILIIGAIIGMFSVIIGAFAAHGLKTKITPESLQTFETGVRYQMYHALLLLFVGSSKTLQQKHKNIIFYLIIIGVLFFSGSIYGLATNSLSAFDFKTIGFITPIGGLFLIMAWIVMLIGFVKNNDK